MEVEDNDIDFWGDRLNIRCGGYNSLVDNQIYMAAKLIVDARENGNYIFVDMLSEKLNISREHAELIQYILGSVNMLPLEGKPHYADCFTYGASPRGLFVDDMDMAKKFITEFEEYLKSREK